jgi:hypothetical protein
MNNSKSKNAASGSDRPNREQRGHSRIGASNSQSMRCSGSTAVPANRQERHQLEPSFEAASIPHHQGPPEQINQEQREGLVAADTQIDMAAPALLPMRQTNEMIFEAAEAAENREVAAAILSMREQINQERWERLLAVDTPIDTAAATLRPMHWSNETIFEVAGAAENREEAAAAMLSIGQMLEAANDAEESTNGS